MQTIKAIAPIIAILTAGGIAQSAISVMVSPTPKKPKPAVTQTDKHRPATRPVAKPGKKPVPKRPMATWQQWEQQQEQKRSRENAALKRCDSQFEGAESVRCRLDVLWPMSPAKK